MTRGDDQPSHADGGGSRWRAENRRLKLDNQLAIDLEQTNWTEIAILDAAEAWLHNLQASPERELSSLITILNGRFEPSGIPGDPLRTPAGLPTGRNLHTFGPNLIPGREA